MISPLFVAIFTSPWFYAFNYYKPRATSKNGDFMLKTQFFQRKCPKSFQNETKK